MSEESPEVTKEEARAFINDVWSEIGPQMSSFNGEHIKGVQKIEAQGEIIFKFTVKSGIGILHCLYEPEEMVSGLLKENEYTAARIFFISLLNKFPLSLLIGATNAAEAAVVKSLEVTSAHELVKTKGQKKTYTAGVKERRKAALMKMAQGNQMLVGTDRPGGEKRITLFTIGIAIETLKSEGKSPAEITHDVLAERLGCDAKSISKYFERDGGSLIAMVNQSFFRLRQLNALIDERFIETTDF
jgi:hypothetical protein